jgi:hypothetical protein
MNDIISGRDGCYKKKLIPVRKNYKSRSGDEFNRLQFT